MKKFLVAAAGACVLTLVATPAQAVTDHQAPSVDRHASSVAVWRPSNGTWYFPGQSPLQWGRSGDIPVPGNYTADGYTDAAVWRPSNGTWYIHSFPGGVRIERQYGRAGDIPVPADYDGDGIDDLAVFRPSNGTWYWISSRTGAHLSRHYGTSGDIPVPADYDGDSHDDLAVFRPSDGSWHVLWSRYGVSTAEQFGQRGDIPVPGRWTQHDHAEFALYRPSPGLWLLLPADLSAGVPPLLVWGKPGDIPVAEQPFLGDEVFPGRPQQVNSFAVFRPSTGTWLETGGPLDGSVTTHFGRAGDIPVPGHYYFSN